MQKITPDAKIKQWAFLLSSNDNKNRLVEFLLDQ